MTELLDKIPRLVEARDEHGCTPIFLAVCKGFRDATQLLLNKGHCNVNAVESVVGLRPLAVAISHEHFHLVDVLVKNGADVNLQDHAGKTSLQIGLFAHATRGHTMKEEPYMAEMKRKWRRIGIKTNSDALLAFLVSHGGDLNAYDCEGVTIKTMFQKRRDPVLKPLLEIQRQRGKDIARQQSTANRPLRTMTKKTKDTETEVNSVSSPLQKSTAKPGSKKKRSRKSSKK
eukprot:XP_011663886.1 PREDICTED: uncharacterized protein LOC105438151 [Strongylocentrotus purpuratus]